MQHVTPIFLVCNLLTGFTNCSGYPHELYSRPQSLETTNAFSVGVNPSPFAIECGSSAGLLFRASYMGGLAPTGIRDHVVLTTNAFSVGITFAIRHRMLDSEGLLLPSFRANFMIPS